MVDIQQRALRALEQDSFSGGSQAVKRTADIADQGRKILPQRQRLLENSSNVQSRLVEPIG